MSVISILIRSIIKFMKCIEQKKKKKKQDK